ncbi:MAG: hypothetical protein IJ870_04815 [Alphaproteobacteria bacterium]|nr:hypothetical protein [Alphaproteobacteria bacterium]
MLKFSRILTVITILILSACASNKEVAEPRRYKEPRFNEQAPIELLVSKVNITSEFSPSFTRPYVEHLFPISLERAARIWATDRLEAADFSANRTADFIIKDASVTEREEKAQDLFHKDSLKYRATLSVVLRVTDANGSTAQTSIEAWRELGIPADTQIDQKEKYWNEMLQKLMADFNAKMQENIEQYLNMYVKNSTAIFEY